MKIKPLYTLAICLLLLTSCDQVVKTVSTMADKNETEKVEGNYTLLANSRIFLPKGFKEISIDSFTAIATNSGASATEAEAIAKHLNQVKTLTSDFHLFYDGLTNANLTIYKLPYTPINREITVQAIASVENQLKLNSNITYTRNEAKFNKYGEMMFLKSSFSIKNKTNGNTFNKTIYVVSGNGKTYMILLETALEADFDKYIQRIDL